MSSTPRRTATEATAATAMAVAVGLAMNGEYLGAGIAAVLGIILFALYEYADIENITLSPEQVEQVVERVESETREVGNRAEEELRESDDGS